MVNQIELHQLYCQRFYNHYEAAQRLLLDMHVKEAVNEFELLYNCFRRKVDKGLGDLNQPGNSRELDLIKRQMLLMRRYLDEFLKDIVSIKKKQVRPQKIISVFDRQCLLKKILSRHISDLETFLDKQAHKN